MKKLILLITLLIGSINITYAQEDYESNWSGIVSGLRARIILEQNYIANGTPIITAYLELHNASDVANPIILKLNKGSNMHFSVVDLEMNELPPYRGPYNGFLTIPETLILPFDSRLRFNISQNGAGIPSNENALIDLGRSYTWVVKKDDKEDYFLKATLKIEKHKDRIFEQYWYGRLEMPKIRIPIKKR